jgi:hypothetical protein
MTGLEAAFWLKVRASTYQADARLIVEDDPDTAFCFRTIAAELIAAADQLAESTLAGA